MLWSRLVSLAILLGFGTACGTKGAVSLSARVENPTLHATAGDLVNVLEGSFDLVLELGNAAPRSTTVSLGSFGAESTGGPIIDQLKFTPDTDFPVTLGEGDTVVVRCELATGNSLATDVDICAGEVWIAGTVTDTLSDGRPTRAISNRFSATCD